MNEMPSSNPTERPKETALENLTFNELEAHAREVNKLAERTFKEESDGFRNVNGSAITVSLANGVYKISGISENLRNFHFYVLHGPDKILEKGHEDKEVLMQAIRKMIEDTGNRIME